MLLECVRHKAKFGNCDKYDYSCTKNKLPVMHKLRKHGGQEPPRKLCRPCDFTCLTASGLGFHQNALHSELEGPQEFKCAFCDYTASKEYSFSKRIIREYGIIYMINEQRQCYSVKSATFHFL